MGLDKALVNELLRGVPDPGMGRDLVATGAIRHIAASQGHVSLKVHLALGGGPPAMEQVARGAQRAIGAGAASTGDPLQGLVVEFVDAGGATVHTARIGPGEISKAGPGGAGPGGGPPAQGGGHRPIGGLGGSTKPTTQGSAMAIPGVKHAIAVGAGKGGVGKSSIAVNLAVGLSRRGHSVGILDGDIYGPSLPTMMGLHELEQSVVAGKLQPFLVHGVKTITLGKLVDAEKPLIWRGPMAHGAFKQLVEQTDWGELDYLIVDLPPGTGDVSLTMAQSMRMTGAVVVCTPQRVAQDDAVRAAKMFQQLGIEVLGVVENMSYFIGDDGNEYDIFGKGGAEKMAARLNVPFLGAVPITTALRKHSDSGDPSANFTGAGPVLKGALEGLVEAVERQVALAAVRQGKSTPTLKIT